MNTATYPFKSVLIISARSPRSGFLFREPYTALTAKLEASTSSSGGLPGRRSAAVTGRTKR